MASSPVDELRCSTAAERNAESRGAGASCSAHVALPALRIAARTADPRVLPSTFLLRDEYEEHLQGPRFASLIAGAVGLLVLTLSCLGIFGVVAYAVTRRSKEMGIRRALGAEDRQIVLPLGSQVSEQAIAAISRGSWRKRSGRAPPRMEASDPALKTRGSRHALAPVLLCQILARCLRTAGS